MTTPTIITTHDGTVIINGVAYPAASVAHAVDCFVSSKGALEQAQRMIKQALPKFNWGASALDANAIQLLNETPVAVNIALKKIAREPVADTVPADVARLVVAARKVAFDEYGGDDTALRELDKASEAFASRVPWEDEPETT